MKILYVHWLNMLKLKSYNMEYTGLTQWKLTKKMVELELGHEINEEEFIFNDIKFGLTGKLFIDDLITKERYAVNLPGSSETHYQWINILCASKGYSYYRTNNKIILVILINEQLKELIM